MRSATLTAEQRELLDRLVARQLPSAGGGRITRYEGDRGAIPLSPAQQRIWFFNQLEPDAVFYNVSGAARLKGRLDSALLHRCLSEIVERHEVLRSTYHQVDGLPVQRVNPFSGLDIPLVDLTHLPVAEREAAARTHCQTVTDRPFDLERDLMLRPVLLRLAEDEHLLLIVQHHIATDGWTMNVLIRELGERYSARVHGVEPRLPELTVQYGDFAAWQREQLSGPVIDRQLEYWKEQLAENRLVDIATGLPTTAEPTWRGSTIPYRIEPGTFRRLTELAESERATPFMALLAAQSLVLSRWSGQDDIIIGSAVAGRRRAELENLAGCFVNELVLRMRTTGSPTYRELLRQAREVCLKAYDHQDVPFERIIEVITPERDTRAKVPLVRHQMGFDNSPRWSVELPELSFTVEPLSTKTARFDIEVDLEPDDDGGVRGTIYFSTDVFTEDVVRRMMDSLTTVIASVLEAPDTPVRSLPVVGDLDSVRLAEEPGDAPVEPDGTADGTVPALLAEQARQRPDAVAVRHGAQSLTFRELDERANRLSWRLRELGVLDGQPVAVCLPPSPRLLVALLGVLKSGAVAVPLSPDARVDDLNDVLLDCSTALVLTDGAGPDGLDPMVEPVDMADDLGDWPADRPAATPGPEQGAFVNYRPPVDSSARGLVNTHAGVVHRLRQAVRTTGASGDQAVLTTGSAFDLAPWELLWPLVAGARLVLPADTTPAALAGTVRDESVAVLACTPSTLAALLDTDGPLPSLRQVVCAGERPWPALVARLREAAPDAALHLRSGRADAALDVVVQSFTEPEPGALPGLRPPAAGAVLRVLDAAGLPVPGALPGELCVGGVPLPDGILGRPQELRRLLVEDPLGDGQVLRTGLRARRLPDGTLDVLTEELRIRTHPVETSDVAAVLHKAPDVDRALVTAHPGDHDDAPDLVAHVSLRAADATGGDRQRALFEEIYAGRAAEDDPALNVTGWTSPHTGETLTAAEMREWADTTFRRVMALRPAKVLEIGCRTGTLLFRLALRCAEYTGTDLSAHALRHIRDHQDWLASKVDDVTLLERAADDFEGLPDDGFDTVVLNALVQHFPSTEYLERVLEGALRVLRPGGHVYLGSVRSLPLAGALHLPGRLELLEPEDPAARLREALAARMGQEEELLLDPRYFGTLPARLEGLGEVYLLPRLSRTRNELSLYHYDVVLRAHDPAAPAAAPAAPALDWRTAGLTARSLAEHLAEQAPERLLVGSVPDARLHARLTALDALHEGRTHTVADTLAALAPSPAAPGGPVDPAALVAAAEKAGYSALVQFGPREGEMELFLSRTAADGDAPSLSLPPGLGRPAPGADAGDAPLASDPSGVARTKAVTSDLRRRLTEQLPFHAVPAHVVVVPGFAVDGTGLADRHALPRPDVSGAAADAQRAPSTATELALAGIWTEALGVDRVGVHDDFFALGGHSLLGSEVMERVRGEYEIDVPLSLLFESPTIAAIAAFVDEQTAKPRETPAAIQRVDRSALRRRKPGAPSGSAVSKEHS
ncbi:non-ribosomal peptide synthetase [Streptomyces muensis]|uniref:Condensation domain-containing protein n=1 Tax=Streptomyces muensis TaxID=1077944 RepID=A0A9X1Q0S0_STRM4|nr:condensation domain-containing protein [Streptomyces muensis]MCF1596902.1 condensation domain-containing protein [Streptomyces muensis]